MREHPVKRRKKMIEVAIPLEAINAASVREKSIRHGHPSTLHLWWARRPLAAARSVIFCQMVDDPSAVPEEFPTEEDQENERLRLFALVSELVTWENTTNELVLNRAREEIKRSWRRACADNADHPDAAELFNPEKLPGFHDPFAGGGALPLEAQRLGLEAYASDLNPVAVLINKAMIEIPPKFAGLPPVNPESRHDLDVRQWKGAQGLAEDVRYYGNWMRDEAEKRIGHLYPKIKITPEMVAERPYLSPFKNKELTVIAWIWARTVESPNPAFTGRHTPLASTWDLSRKKGNEAWIFPYVCEKGKVCFDVRVTGDKAKVENIGRKGTRCMFSGDPVSLNYIRDQGKRGLLGRSPMALVLEGKRRVYIPSSLLSIAEVSSLVTWRPELEINYHPRDIKTQIYGLTSYAQLFTDRQLIAINTFGEILDNVKQRVSREVESLASGDSEKEKYEKYANAVCTYLAFAIDKGANYWSTLCAWSTTTEKMMSTFGRQALPMVWDYCEANPFSDSSGNWSLGVSQAAKMLEKLGTGKIGLCRQEAAQGQQLSSGRVVGTDPPYYDNIGYADLSDFFYVWLRRSLGEAYPDLFGTLAVPKSEELVATPYRHGSKEKAESFFLEGMREAMLRISCLKHPAFPATIFYAFKQSETAGSEGTVSTGWETFIEAVLGSGLSIKGTWPIRTELTGNLKKNMAALASSLVLVCDPPSKKRISITRKDFRRLLKENLSSFLSNLESVGTAPVDIQQSMVGPGIMVYFDKNIVMNPDDSIMSVREALIEINASLDEYLSQDDGDLDPESRFALTYFESYGYEERDFGDAEGLAKARNISVAGVAESGILRSVAGKAWLLRREQLDDDWDPISDKRLCVWEATQHLIKRLEASGEGVAAELLLQLKNVSGHGDLAANCKALAYRLYNHCEKKKQAEEARAYNGLVIAWPELERLASASSTSSSAPRQTTLI